MHVFINQNDTSQSALLNNLTTTPPPHACMPVCRLPDQVSANAAAAGSGPASLTAAVRQALQVLQCVCPPASACAPSLAPAGGPVQHTPDEPGWEQLLTGAVGVLRASEELQQLQNPAVAGVDTGFARQEFITGGQQVGVLLLLLFQMLFVVCHFVQATPSTSACGCDIVALAMWQWTKLHMTQLSSTLLLALIVSLFCVCLIL